LAPLPPQNRTCQFPVIRLKHSKVISLPGIPGYPFLSRQLFPHAAILAVRPARRRCWSALRFSKYAASFGSKGLAAPRILMSLSILMLVTRMSSTRRFPSGVFSTVEKIQRFGLLCKYFCTSHLAPLWSKRGGSWHGTFPLTHAQFIQPSEIVLCQGPAPHLTAE
jgi:hypothetical protein